MMNHLMICMALVSAGAVAAQLDSPPSPVGTSHTRGIGPYAPLAGEGTGNVWDVSAAVPQQTYAQPFSSAPASFYSKTFPDAEWILDDGGVLLFYSSTDSLAYYGGVQQGLVIQYDNPQSALVYPMGVGDAWWDEFSSEYTANDLMVHRTGTTEATCLASGSLVLPNGQQFSEAYRIKITEAIQDSTVLGNYNITIEGDYAFVPEHPMQVYAALIIQVTDEISGTPTQTTTIGSWLHNTAVGVQDAVGGAQFAISPNPVRAGEAITVAWPVEAKPATVFNAAGEAVREVHAVPGVAFSVLSTAGLEPGMYVLASPGIPSQRFVVH